MNTRLQHAVFFCFRALTAARVGRDLMNPSHVLRLVVLVAAALFCSVCASGFISGSAYALGARSASQDINDSGYVGRTSRAPDIHWLDNDRIIFLGYKPGEFRIENDQKMPRAEIMVWNTATGQLNKHADVTTDSWLCSSRGYVNYGHFQRSVRYARSGEFGKERETRENGRRPQDEPLELSPVSCRDFDPTELRKRYGANPISLRGQDEYLDRTHGGDTMRYFPGGGRSPVSLTTIPTRSVDTTPRYSAHADKYVFQERRSTSGADIPHNVWLLDRRGAVTHAAISTGPWMAGAVEALPVVPGLVMMTTAIAIGRGVGAAGIYLVEGGKPRRLLAGVPYGMSVSPDGCKVGVSINTDWGKQPNPPPRIMLINLCTGKM